MAKTSLRDQPPAPVPREPSASHEIPIGLRDSNLGLEANSTINAWALDRVLSHLGAHRVDIIDGVAVSNDGKYCELVQTADKLLIFDRL